MEENPKKSEVSKKQSVYKSALFVILSILIVAGTFFFEERVAAKKGEAFEQDVYVSVEGRNEVEVQSFESEFWDRFARKHVLSDLDTIRTNESDSATVYFPKGTVLRLASNTKVSFDFSDSKIVIDLKEGQMWVNALFSNDDFEIMVGDVRIVPFNSVFDLSLDKSKLSLYSHKNHVRSVFYDGEEFLNSIFVTEGNQIEVNLNKLSNKLSKVLYSKLIKEFHYGKLSQDSFDANDFYIENNSKDNVYFDRISSDKLQALRSQPLNNVSVDTAFYKFKALFNSLNSYLVFNKYVKDQRVANFFLKHLFDAEHLFAYFSLNDAYHRLDLFEKLLQVYEFSDDEDAKNMLASSLLEEFNDFSFVNPNSDLFPLRVFIRSSYLDLTQSGARDPLSHFYVIRTYLNDASNVIDSDKNLAQDFVDDYYRRMKVAVSSYFSSLEDFKNLLIEENQVFDNMLLRSSVLYKDKYFSYKTFLEEEWLTLVLDEDSKKEEKKMMISKKIIFLKKLKDYFLNEEVSIEDAKSVIYRLFEEIELYREGNSYEEMDQMFSNTLSDLDTFWNFLNSPEYSVSLNYGTTRRERYDAFLGIQKSVSGLESFRKKMLSEDVKVRRGSVQDAEKEVSDAFSALNVEKIEILELESYTQRFVDVYGVLSDMKFSCTYDRDGQFLTDVSIEGEFLTSGIRLEKLSTLIKSYKSAGGISVNKESNPKVASETKEEKIAKILIVEKLFEYGHEVLKEDIKVLDLENGIFEISDSISFPDLDFKYTFEFDSFANVVSKVKLYLPEFEKELDGVFRLSDLLEVISKEVASDNEEEV